MDWLGDGQCEVTVSTRATGAGPDNSPPELSYIPPQTVFETEMLSFDVTASDPDGPAPSLAATGLPPGADFNDNGDGQGGFTWTPGTDQAGNWYPVLWAFDGLGGSDSQTVVITVEDVCVDDDGDGWCSEEDNCPNVHNVTQADLDSDGLGNPCDNCPNDYNVSQADSDNDGAGDLCDNCLSQYNPSQADPDGDGFGSVCDNCPAQANAGQADSDNDAVGDYCDRCPEDYDPLQYDTDGDLVGDECDNCPEVENTDQADADSNGVGDACEFPTDVDDQRDAGLPDRYALWQNYPNPFNPATEIAFDLPRAGHVLLQVYNINGRLVATLVNGSMTAGRHTIEWAGRDASGREVTSGVYFYRLETSTASLTRKMLLLR